MTARELIQMLQSLGEENLDRKIVMFDNSAVFTPSAIKVLDEKWSDKLVGKILID